MTRLPSIRLERYVAQASTMRASALTTESAIDKARLTRMAAAYDGLAARIRAAACPGSLHNPTPSIPNMRVRLPMGPLALLPREDITMNAPGPPTSSREVEREHLARAHHEICTALTVFSSNVQLVRIVLRDAPPGAIVVPVHAHLDELEGAVDRLRRIAREMKQWHDGTVPTDAAAEQPKRSVRRAA